jgi:hypothetical protein
LKDTIGSFVPNTTAENILPFSERGHRSATKSTLRHADQNARARAQREDIHFRAQNVKKSYPLNLSQSQTGRHRTSVLWAGAGTILHSPSCTIPVLYCPATIVHVRVPSTFRASLNLEAIGQDAEKQCRRRARQAEKMDKTK